jgi:uncharacterized membrane protein YjgN (DUF898 family)
MPLWDYKSQTYQVNNLYFGTERFTSTLKLKDIYSDYRVYFVGVALSIAMFTLLNWVIGYLSFADSHNKCITSEGD